MSSCYRYTFVFLVFFLYFNRDGFAFEETLSDKLWHSYIFNSGAGNREGLKFFNFQQSEFSANGNIRKWQSMRDQYGVSVLGLGENFIQLITIDKQNVQTSVTEDFHHHLADIITFQSWNSTSQRLENFAVVAGCEKKNKCYLNWYQISNGNLMLLWNWPFNKDITQIESVMFNYELKLLIIGHTQPSYNSSSAEMYSFTMDSYLSLSSYDRLVLDGNPSSVSMTQCDNYILLSFTFPKTEMIFMYKYHMMSGHNEFKLYQKIYSKQVTSTITFQNGFHCFLAIASLNSSIHKIIDNSELTSVTKLSFGKKEKWFAVPLNTYRKDMILLAEEHNEMSLVSCSQDFQSLGNLSRMVCEADNECAEALSYLSTTGATSFFFNDHYNILFISNTGKSKLISFSIKMEPLMNLAELEFKEILHFKSVLELKLNEQYEALNRLDETLQNVLVEENGIVGNHWELEHANAEYVSLSDYSSGTIGNTEYAEHDKWTNDDYSVYKNLMSDFQTESLIDNQLQEIHLVFNELESRAVIGNRTLPILVADSITFFGEVVVDELELSQLNGIDVDDMLQNSFMLGSNKKIGGIKTVTNIHLDSITFEEISGVSASNIMFSDEPETSENKNFVNGDIVYENDITVLKKVEVLSSLKHNIHFASPPNFYRFSFNAVTFDHLQISEESIIGETVNGRPLILPIHSSPFDMHALDNINQARVERINVKYNLSVNTINGQSFFRQLNMFNRKLMASSDSSPVKSENSFSAGEIEIEYLNNVKFPEGFVTVDANKGVIVSGSKSFSGQLIIHDLRTKIDAKHLPDVVDSRNVRIFNNIKVSETLIADNINMNIRELLSDILKSDEDGLLIEGKKKFQKCHILQTLKLNGMFNSVDPNYILNNYSDQPLVPLQQLDDVSFRNLNGSGLWDGLDVNSVNQSIVRLSKSKTYESDLIFADPFTPFFNILTSSEITDHILNSEANEHLEVHDYKTGVEMNAKNVVINGSLFTSNQINGVNLNEFNRKRMSLTKPQSIERNLNHQVINIRGELKVLKMGNQENGKSFVEDNADHNSNILSSMSGLLKYLVVKGNIKTLRGVNGFDLVHIQENAVSVIKSSFISQKIIFNDSIILNHLRVNRRVQGIQLRLLYQDLVFEPDYVSITGEKKFLSNLTVTNTMKIHTLNGYLVQRIITKEGDHSVKELININGNVLVRGNLTLYGSVNDCSMAELLRKYSTKHNSYILRRDAHLNVGLVHHLFVGGKIQNKSFSSDVLNLVMVNDTSNITAKKIYLSPVYLNSNVIVEELNGLNITRFYEDVILRNNSVRFDGDIIIKNAIIRNVEVNSDFNSTLIHGIDTNEWVEECILLNEDATLNGKKTIKNAYSFKNIVTDFINDHLPFSTITLNDDQFIPNSGYFPAINSTSDIFVGGRVNGKILDKEVEDSLMVSNFKCETKTKPRKLELFIERFKDVVSLITKTKLGGDPSSSRTVVPSKIDNNVNRDQEVGSRMIFLNEVVGKRNIFVNSVNNRILSNVMTLHTDQVIKSLIKFSNKVITNSDINNVKIVNGIDIKKWSQQSISLNQNQIIRGSWKVTGNLTIHGGVNGSGLLNSVSVEHVRKSIEKVRMLTEEVHNGRLLNFQDQCAKVSNFSDTLSLQPTTFHQFEIFQVLKPTLTIESVITFQANKIYYMIITFSNECLSVLYKWNDTVLKYSYINHINIGPVSKWITLHYDNATYLITTSLNDSACEKNLKRSNVWVFDRPGDEYGHLYSSEAFVDILARNESSKEYYTLGNNGTLIEWTLGSVISSSFVTNIGKEKYRFIDFDVTGELAFTNGKELRNRENKIIYKFHRAHYGPIIATKLNKKTLSAVIFEDEIVIYENLLHQKIYASIPAFKVGSILWFNYGNGQSFLIYETQKKYIDMIPIRGTSHGVNKATIPMTCFQIASVSISRAEDIDRQMLFVIQKKKMFILEAQFVGNLLKNESQSCL